ncbi:GNAT family N-acetyltransferase [Ornithinimicrobium murale]|uniref:GNAT family N-acetyltransferase n=1 Tax=Ornithinimicrobium murale TaxID=1050153 RepID=UPI000E0CD682|nr:GNAT family N-acetyltransferase [Ornithinimicrobium murale]
MPLTVRPAVPEEFERVGEITAVAYVHDGHLAADFSYVEVLRDAAARANAAELLVATDGATILGTVTWCPDGSPYKEVAAGDEGEFRMLAVLPEARGRGVARALVQACLDRSRETGHARIVLSTQPSMAPAHALYESFGFVRDPARDWEPVPGIHLVAYALDLLQAAG